jgi:tetratricopeptide (TPR) repeat protein
MLQKINRNQVFYIFLLITTLTLIIAYALAEKQNKGYWQDYLASEEVVKLLASDQNEQAGQILEDLVPRHPESPQISWYYAVYLANIGQYQKAQDYYNRALELSPDFITNEVFLWRYGENLYHLGKVEEAKQYLEQCSSTSTNPEIKKEADEILEKIINGE